MFYWIWIGKIIKNFEISLINHSSIIISKTKIVPSDTRINKMGLCASSIHIDVNRKNGLNNHSQTDDIKKTGSQIKLSNTGSTVRNFYATSSDKKKESRSTQMKLGFAVPQSLLQREHNADESKMTSQTRDNIMIAFKKEDSGISQFSANQLKGKY
jgi:hypothetical protein